MEINWPDHLRVINRVTGRKLFQFKSPEGIIEVAFHRDRSFIYRLDWKLDHTWLYDDELNTRLQGMELTE